MIDWQEIARSEMSDLRFQVLEAVEASPTGYVSPGVLAARFDCSSRQVERQLEKLRAKRLIPPPQRRSPEERFWATVDVRGADDCWPWRGAISPTGYPAFQAAEGEFYAHRFAYTILVGPIPADCDLDHTCHNADKSCFGASDCPHRSCVNPAHLEAVSHAENIRRGRTAEVQRNRHQSRTHCRRGHALVGDNVKAFVVDGRPHRACRRCKAESEKRRQADRKPIAERAA